MSPKDQLKVERQVVAELQALLVVKDTLLENSMSETSKFKTAFEASEKELAKLKAEHLREREIMDMLIAVFKGGPF